jgi:hypothetical protein
MTGRLVGLNNKLERMWKQTPTDYFDLLHPHIPGRSKAKNGKHVNIAGFQAKTGTWGPEMRRSVIHSSLRLM